MGKILYTANTEKGTLNYIAGTVTSVRENEDERHPYVISMNCSVYSSAEKKYIRKLVQLQSWPGQKYSTIDRVKKMHPEPGSFIFCVVGNLKEYQPRKGDTILQALLFNINYSGHITARDDASTHLVCGIISNIDKKPDGSAVVTIKSREYNSEERKSVDMEYVINVGAKQFAGLQKANIAKSGNFAAVGTLADGVMQAKRSEYAEYTRKNGKDQKN